jgi:uncharacterized protein YecE (DUF72 family)
LLVGCSGWSYSAWEGIFYPHALKAKLSYYSKVFRTAEVDSTFYHLPPRRVVEAWATSTPPGFVFSAKVPKSVTHEKKLSPAKGVERDVQEFLDLLKPLDAAGKLGALLVQLPPSFKSPRDLGRLEAFLALLPRGVNWVVEFRHPSWWAAPASALLERYGVGSAIVDAPDLPAEPLTSAGLRYIRFHGRGASVWYNYFYSEEELRPWAERIRGLSERSEPVLIYFNNHHRAYAVANALQLLKLLGALEEGQAKVLARLQGLLSEVQTPEMGRATNIPEQLRLLTTEERWSRALQIPGQEITLEATGELARGWVGGYYTYVSLATRTIRHECPDWQKAVELGRLRLCKHLLAFIGRLPPDISQSVAESLIKEGTGWRLEAHTSF